MPDPTWSLCPAAQGADGPGSRCRRSHSQLWLPAPLLARPSEAGGGLQRGLAVAAVISRRWEDRPSLAAC